MEVMPYEKNILLIGCLILAAIVGFGCVSAADTTCTGIGDASQMSVDQSVTPDVCVSSGVDANTVTPVPVEVKDNQQNIEITGIDTNVNEALNTTVIDDASKSPQMNGQGLDIQGPKINGSGLNINGPKVDQSKGPKIGNIEPSAEFKLISKYRRIIYDEIKTGTVALADIALQFYQETGRAQYTFNTIAKIYNDYFESHYSKDEAYAYTISADTVYDAVVVAQRCLNYRVAWNKVAVKKTLKESWKIPIIILLRPLF